MPAQLKLIINDYDAFVKKHCQNVESAMKNGKFVKNIGKIVYLF